MQRDIDLLNRRRTTSCIWRSKCNPVCKKKTLIISWRMGVQKKSVFKVCVCIIMYVHVCSNAMKDGRRERERGGMEVRKERGKEGKRERGREEVM